MMKKVKEKIRHKIVSDYISMFSKEKIDAKELERAINFILDEIVMKEHIDMLESDRKKVLSELLDEFMGYGPIEGLLKDPSVTEIMINGPKQIYVERNGKTVLASEVFDDEQQLMYQIHKMLSPTRRRVDESNPYTDVSLKDGSRVNIILPPLALEGPVVTIRKFLKEIRQIENLIKMGTLDQRMADFLVAATKAKLNMIFSGATGAGKTTTLNVLSGYLPNEDRIITIEDTAELKLDQEHLVRLETRTSNIEGRGEVTLRDLFKNTLRMRPDRLILGEIRGAEALDMLQAMCSGHSGSLAVLHADSPQDVVYRLETMILTSGVPINLEAIHRQIAAALHIIIQQEQLSDGSRKVTHISQINGLKNGQAVVEDLFVYDITHVDPDTGTVKGSWKATGIVPVCFPKFKKVGVPLSADIFRKDE